jgi:hypothetical protein
MLPLDAFDAKLATQCVYLPALVCISMMPELQRRSARPAERVPAWIAQTGLVHPFRNGSLLMRTGEAFRRLL